MESTNSILLNLKYEDLKLKFNNDDKNRIIASKCVSDNELASWLIDYWCSKDIFGLIKMPFRCFYLNLPRILPLLKW